MKSITVNYGLDEGIFQVRLTKLIIQETASILELGVD